MGRERALLVEQLMLLFYHEEEGIANFCGRAMGHMTFLGSRVPTAPRPGSNITPQSLRYPLHTLSF
jgi:hypothetical protein